MIGPGKILTPYQKPNLGAMLNYSHPLAKGLVCSYLFNERGGNNIKDTSGRGFHGISNLPIWATDEMGPSHQFNNDPSYYYVDCGYPIIGSTLTGLTVECWFYNVSSTSSQMLAENGTSYNTNTFFLHYDTTVATYQFLVWKSGGTYGQRSTATITNFARFHHLVGVWTPSRTDLYFNSIKSTVGLAANQLDVLGNGNTALNLGRRPSATPTKGINYGKISVFRAWNRGLSDREVSQLYQSPYAMFQRDRAVIWKAPAAGGATFKPAWAMNCNRLIGSGLYV
jgi:hypothetical protein